MQLYSIEQMPPTVPVWDTLLEDLGHPPAARVARVLGVGRATVYRWNATGRAPRAALLALFWLTRWGRSAVHTQATNDALMAVSLARSYREECNKLRAKLPIDLDWPVIEPADPECGETRALPGADDETCRLLVLRQAHPSDVAFPARVATPAPGSCTPPVNEGGRDADKANTAQQVAVGIEHGGTPQPAKKASARCKAQKAAARPERPARLGPTSPSPRASMTPDPKDPPPRKPR